MTIEDLSGFHDEYREALEDIIAAKAEGKALPAPAEDGGRRRASCVGCQQWDLQYSRRGVCPRCRYQQHLGEDGLCRGCLLAVRTERTTCAVLDFPAPTQLRLLIPGASEGARRLGRPRIEGPAVSARCVLPATMPGQRRWPEEDALKQHTLVLARQRGLSGAWCNKVGRRLRLALAVRDAEGERKVSREILEQGRGMEFGAAAAQEVLEHAGLWRGPVQLADQMRPHRIGVPGGTVTGCADCGSWGITTRLCTGCANWHRRENLRPGRCTRCVRDALPLHARSGPCRGCLTFVQNVCQPSAEFTQLTFAGVLAHRVVGEGKRPRAAPSPEHDAAVLLAACNAAAPGQTALLSVPRDWLAVHAVPEHLLPPLSTEARALLDQFALCLPATADGQANHTHSIRMLCRLLAYTGVEEPVSERDVRALAVLEPNVSLHRIVFFLHERGLLTPDHDRTTPTSPSLARLDTARTDAWHRQAIEAKHRQLSDAMADQMRTWVTVRRGEGRRHPPAPYTRIRRDLHVVLPVLMLWSKEGLDLREITTAHVSFALSDRQGHQARGVHHVLLSVFRALKQERTVFTNPLAGLSLTTPVRLPEPLPSDRLRGLLDLVDSAMGRLAVGLVAVHAIKVTDVAQLPLTALDLACGTLKVHLRSQQHTVYLDSLTRQLLGDWLLRRHDQWPASPNPHLLVTTHSAHHPALPPVSYCALRRAFDCTGITPRQMWSDRVLDEARQTADPVHLVHLFGIHPGTAVRYVHTAHPDKALPPIR
ncbi:hypothetical protein [Streptomyces sp. st115]|uniref:hypothetical protein n=1 Tax=Streptomyces sp. st115 TaxID=1828047 RepID=UPI00211D5F98|nr:hypothetical protein [Streptomyces sp. st115]